MLTTMTACSRLCASLDGRSQPGRHQTPWRGAQRARNDNIGIRSHDFVGHRVPH